MRTAIAIMVLMVGCVAADESPTVTGSASHPRLVGVAASIDNAGTDVPEAPDLCTLAAQLPAGDICANVCDPDAMKAQLIAEGEPAGTCLEFSCEMPNSTRVIVGVCLPPN